MEKYDLTSETQIYWGIKLFRIKALKDFSNVAKGALGGWVEKKKKKKIIYHKMVIVGYMTMPEYIMML